MRAATLFSGIGAPEQAMPSWQWLWHAEIEPFPAAVMAARHPGSINLGDVTSPDFPSRAQSLGHLDVLVGGPPCQAFSVAGNRGSLGDARGNLSLRWVEIIHAVRPDFAVTENVPGWLSAKDNAFGHFLGALVGADGPLPSPPGQSWPDAGMAAGPFQRVCWRILDAQYFGVPQRRRRVFVVSCPSDGGDPSHLLLERASLQGHPPPSRETGQDTAGSLAASTGGSDENDARDGRLITGPVTSCGGTERKHGHGWGQQEFESGFIVPIAFGGNNTAGPSEIATAVNAHGGPHGRLDFGSETFVTFDTTQITSKANRSHPRVGDPCHPLCHPLASDAHPPAIAGSAVRRLTPRECERLQGFEDDHTAIAYRGKPAADGPRYRAIGNSMAVPVLRWLLQRLERQHAAMAQERAA